MDAKNWLRFSKVLVVEDDLILSQFIKRKLDKIGLDAHVVTSGKIGLKEVLTNQYSLIILDVNLPEFNGLQILEHARKKEILTPAIITTVKSDSETAKLSYLKGANLFIPKPIDFGLLEAQIQSLIRLHMPKAVIELGPLKIEPQKRMVTRRGKIINITPKEFETLMLLIQLKGNVITRQGIINYTSRATIETNESSVDTLVSRLRNKLGTYKRKDIIETIYGIGFRLNPDFLD